MSVPKDLWVNVYLGSGYAYESKANADACADDEQRKGGRAHHYRLVEEKREVVAYVAPTHITDADVEAMAADGDVAIKSILRRLAGLTVRGRAQARADRAIARWRAGQLSHPRGGVAA